jgi:hypothetical protein
MATLFDPAGKNPSAAELPSLFSHYRQMMKYQALLRVC